MIIFDDNSYYHISEIIIKVKSIVNENDSNENKIEKIKSLLKEEKERLTE